MQSSGYMKENKLIIAAAGAGKTTHLVNMALQQTGNVLITTFTDENESEIRNKFIEICGYIPKHITIQTWFSVLLQHGVRPYQGTCYSELFDKEVRGILLVNSQSGIKCSFQNKGKTINVSYSEEYEFMQHYFSSEMKLFTDKLSKFVIKANERSQGKVIDRICNIYPNIYIDEVQDLVGYDLELLKLLFHSTSSIICVGDPRQVTYYTHWEKMYGKYKNGRIKVFVQEKCYKRDRIKVDEETLSVSHRNNKQICDYSNLLYPSFSKISPCHCNGCHPSNIEHQGVYIVGERNLDCYLDRYHPVQLRYNIEKNVNQNYSCYNFGESKGKSFERVVIYPTKDIKKWVLSHGTQLSDIVRAKFYVAITRARFSVALVMSDSECRKITDLPIWQPQTINLQ